MEWTSTIPDRGSPQMTTRRQQASQVGRKARRLRYDKANARINRRHRWSGFRPQAGGIAGLIALADPAGLVEKEVVQRPSVDRQITSVRLGDHQDPPHDKQRVRNYPNQQPVGYPHVTPPTFLRLFDSFNCVT